ncbi:MAG: hypothetical protein KJZ59_11135 [Pararhodobacter sp.]|nr:hypothetical protein [Pararhodobacter sp.]
MANKTRLTLVLILIWAALFAASFLLPMRIDGPRNLDTGFQRLDILARYQMLAFGAAVVTALAGVLWRKQGKRVMLIGFVPLLITALLIAALVVATFVGNRLTPPDPITPPRATAPAEEAQD